MRSLRPVWLVLSLLACNLPWITAAPEIGPAVASPIPLTGAPVFPTGTPIPEPVEPTATAVAEILPPLPDLDQSPLYWFAPLPPMPTGPGRMFTGFIVQYFLEKAGLGFSGEDGNLAFGASVRVSNFLPGSEGQYAIDRDLGTTWSSGNGPVQWIEIDLGSPFNISLIRLIPSQFPEGPTIHNIYGRGPDGDLVLLATLEGDTADSVPLEYAPAGGWPGIQVIRIETAASPSWVAWREIEVYGAP